MSALAKHLRLCHTAALCVMGPTFVLSLPGFVGAGWEMVVGVLLTLVAYGVLGGYAIWGVRTGKTIEDGGGDLDKLVNVSSPIFLTYAIVAFVIAWGGGLLTMASCGLRYISPMLHWGGLILCIGGFWAWFSLPKQVQKHGGTSAHSKDFDTLPKWLVPLCVFGVWGIAWMVITILLVGSGPDTSKYPGTASYRLPYPDGSVAWVMQGNNTNFNHEGGEEYAWDFRLRCGTDVVAARRGQLGTTAVDTNDGHGGGTSNNEVTLVHPLSGGGQEISRYLHIKKGSIVRTDADGDGWYEAGEKIAEVGNVGNSLTGHIHFVVERGGTNQPVKFSDVSRHDGIPRSYHWYWAGN